MWRSIQWQPIFIAVLCTGLAVGSAGEKQKEIRQYRVFVDDSESGDLSIVYEPQPNGIQRFEVRSTVQCGVWLMKYRYSLRVFEQWRNGRLDSLKSIADDNGTKTRISLENNNGLVLRVNEARPQKAAICVASTSIAVMPPVDSNHRAVLLHVDTGQIVESIWNNLGHQNLRVGGREVACDCYEVSGGLEAKFWFDANGRLVKQAFHDSGAEVSVVLNAVSHETVR